MKTWEVKLDTAGNGLVQMNVEADAIDFAHHAEGVALVSSQEDGTPEAVAFFPIAKLVSIREVTP